MVADDVGVDAIGCYGLGSSPPPTPNIDALAARGLLMTRAHACPTCSPTRACLQTGRYPFRTGVGAPEGADLGAAETLLPEVIAATGRPRALFGKWHLGDNGDTTPNDEGWPYFAGTLGGALTDYSHFTLITNGSTSTVDAYATSNTVDLALAWIQSQRRPWLAMVCFNAAHTPLHDPPALLHSYHLNGLDPNTTPVPFFKAMVEAMDTEIGRLLAGLGTTTLANTTVIFLGDNGTARDVVQSPFVASHAKGTLYEGGTQVPMIVAGPAVLGAPRTTTALVDAVDLFTTIAGLCGVNAYNAVPPGTQLDGHDLRPLLTGAATSVRDWSYSEQFGGTTGTDDGYAMQDSRYKLIRFTGGTSVLEKLYDLQSDPYEATDLLSGTPGAVATHAYLELRLEMARLRNEGSVGSVGTGCAGAAGIPVLSASTVPRIGQIHSIVVSPIAPTIAAFGLLGFSLEAAGPLPLPVNLSVLGFTGCLLFISPDASLPATLGPGSASLQVMVPNDVTLLGAPFFQQMVIIEPTANPGGAIFSNALAQVIGP